MISLFRLTVLDLVLVNCMFLESFLFLIGCQILLAIIVHSIKVFCISALSIEICLFSFLSLLFWVLYLSESSQRFVNFVYPFREPTLGFTDFFFFIAFSITTLLEFFSFDLYDFLPSAHFTFYSFFNVR